MRACLTGESAEWADQGGDRHQTSGLLATSGFWQWPWEQRQWEEHEEWGGYEPP